MNKKVHMSVRFNTDTSMNEIEFRRSGLPFGYQDPTLTPTLKRLLKAKAGDKVLIVASKRKFKGAKSLTVGESRFSSIITDLKITTRRRFAVCTEGFTQRFGKPVDGSKLYYSARVVK